MPDSIFKELADYAPVMIWRSTPDKLCDWFNKPWLDFVGRTMEQERGYGWAEGVHPEDLDRCVGIYNAAFDARETFSMTYRLRRCDGAYRWLQDNGAPFYRAGEFAGYFGSCLDVTEQREEHALLVQAVAQSDALLREVYHRVKNNLQQIEGLIAIERLQLTDPRALHAIESLSGRIRAMAGVHQALMRSKNLTDINIREFIADLCANIASAQGAEAHGIAVRVVADAREVHIEQAMVLGLLVNELVTNALKHAFPGGEGGEIVVSYGVTEPGRTVLQIADNGAGFADGASNNSQGSGLRLIEGFAHQLNGELSFDHGRGTVVRVALAER